MAAASAPILTKEALSVSPASIHLKICKKDIPLCAA